MVKEGLCERVVEVGDRVMTVVVVSEEDVQRLICGYAPQSGRSLEEKQSFYDVLKGEWHIRSAGDLGMCFGDNAPICHCTGAGLQCPNLYWYCTGAGLQCPNLYWCRVAMPQPVLVPDCNSPTCTGTVLVPGCNPPTCTGTVLMPGCNVPTCTGAGLQCPNLYWCRIAMRQPVLVLPQCRVAMSQPVLVSRVAMPQPVLVPGCNASTCTGAGLQCHNLYWYCTGAGLQCPNLYRYCTGAELQCANLF